MRFSEEEKLQTLLSDITKLCRKINLEDDDFIKSLNNEEAREYVKGLKISKPESLLSDKLFKPVIKLTGITQLPEARVGEGWVDFILASSNSLGLPVAIELKSLHNSNGYLNSLESVLGIMRNEYEKKKSNQIVKYIVSQNGVEYVVLTNLCEVFIFDKSCVLDFKPVLSESFVDFINGISGTKNISDYLKRQTQGLTRHDLDKQFIRDLKKWYGYLQELQWKDDPKNNSVLLLNKLIFALTLEDFIIIDYRYVWETFVSAYKKWKTKGSMKVLEAFFHDLDEFLYEYYDTELFVSSSNILSKLEPTKENYDKALEVLKRVAGFDEQTNIFSEGLYSYSFRVIDEDVFGKSYETFLAEDRKDQGIYYTPIEITRHMSAAIVNEIFRPLANEIVSNINESHFDVAHDRLEQFLSCGIIDPSCGSGPFLIGILREIYQIYQDLDKETIWAEQQFAQHSLLLLPPDVAHKIEETGKIRSILGLGTDGVQRDLISKIILRHIFGSDLDSTALNVAKVNLWKEAVKLNPKSFYYQELPENENHILPDLELNFINGDSVICLPDEQIIGIMQSEFKIEIQEMIAQYRRYLEYPTESEIPGRISELKKKIRARLDEEFRKSYVVLKNPLYFPLEYFFFYFDENGNPLNEVKRGFAGAIGNPPWNNIKPNKKEFAAKHPEIFGEGISKYSISGKEFEKLFADKTSNPDIKAEWESYVSYFRELSRFISDKYKLQHGGDFSLQKVFTERFLSLAKRAFSILIPSNFHTDEGTYLIRKEVIENWEIRELISFENRGKVWFPDIHAQFKFDMLLVSKDKIGRPFKARFYVTDWKQIDEAFDYPVQLVGKISPYVMGITEFRSSADIRLMSKIRGNYKLLKETGIVLRSELHETNDKDIFSDNQIGLILYEGKMIHQYNPHFSNNRYFVEENLGRQRLISRTANRILDRLKGLGINADRSMIEDRLMDKTLNMDYECERLVFRDVASSTNERTLISCIVPRRVFLANTLPYIEPFNLQIENGNSFSQKPMGDYIYYIQALFNSFVIDYYVRQRVTSHLNFFFVYEIPIPDVAGELLKTIISKSKKLMANDDLILRAELEAQIAREVFKLNFDEMRIILDSFTYGNINEALKNEIMERMKP